MIARVALDLALRREFDYEIPPEMSDRAVVGRRVKVPFGRREVLGSIVAVLEHSERATLRPLSAVLGAEAQFTPEILELARWMAGYYCCPLESVLKSVLPDAVRKENPGWRERLKVRILPHPSTLPALTKRQQDLWNILEEWRELALQELLRLAGTTAGTVRRLEDKGLVTITSEVAERDPYAADQILPTDPLVLNPDQARALAEIVATLGPPVSPTVFLLHGVTGSGQDGSLPSGHRPCAGTGQGAIVLVPEISLTPQTVERFKARFSSGPARTLVAVLHSHLSAGERHDEWHKIRQGRARIVIGRALGHLRAGGIPRAHHRG